MPGEQGKLFNFLNLLRLKLTAFHLDNFGRFSSTFMFNLYLYSIFINLLSIHENNVTFKQNVHPSGFKCLTTYEQSPYTVQVHLSLQSVFLFDEEEHQPTKIQLILSIFTFNEKKHCKFAIHTLIVQKHALKCHLLQYVYMLEILLTFEKKSYVQTQLIVKYYKRMFQLNRISIKVLLDNDDKQ